MERTQLDKILNAVAPGLADKDIIDHAQSFIFIGGDVLTYNDEVSVRHPLDIGVDGIAVPAKALLQFLKRAKGKEVKVEQGDGEEGPELVLRCGRSRVGVPIHAEVPEHVSAFTAPEKWTKLPPEFLAAIKFCQFSASRNMAVPLLTNLNVSGTLVESGDDQRYSQYTMSVRARPSFLLPAHVVPMLLRAAPVKYAIDGPWGHFKTESGAIFSCRLFEGKYADISAIMESDKGKEFELPEKLLDVLDRAGVFSVADFDADREVQLTFSAGKLAVKASGVDGWFEEEMAVGTTQKMQFALHPSFLQEILKHSTRAAYDGTKLMFFGDNFRHALAV